MPTYLHPGVYVEEIPSGSRPIEAVGTSTAAFIGYTERGPVGEPVLVTSWQEFEDSFGGWDPVREELRGILPTESDVGDPMGHGAYAFFQNGGGYAYVVRVADEASASTGQIIDGDPLLTIEAASPGTWGDHLRVQIEHIPTTNEPDRVRVEVQLVRSTGVTPLESIQDATLAADDDGAFAREVANGLSMITATVEDTARLRTHLSGAGPVDVSLSGGANGTAGSKESYDDVFALLERRRDVNIIVLPGQSWTGSNTVIDAAVSHCEKMRSRMVLVDPTTAELKNEGEVTSLGLPSSTYTVLYYPWLKVANPYYDVDRNPGAEKQVLVPPSGFMAGLWAKTDGRRGVWKAPAGVETRLLGIADTAHVVEDAQQDFLNPLGVNAIRSLPGYGSVVWGSRTLATKADPEWRYVPVRRTAIFIEQSIYNGIQWAVFEPNDHRLWSSLRTNIESFMNGLFRVGAFQGEKASDAYFVRCGLGATMTQGDIDRGQVIVLVGFAPLKPAEFVIVRIQQKVGQQ
jgi:phage tail sheath protein FI